MFGPIWLFFFAQDQEFTEWTVHLPAAAEWTQQDVEIASVSEVQE